MGWIWHVLDEVDVIDIDPEYADMSNPRGEIYGLCYRIMAEREDGTRFAGQDCGIGEEGRELAEFLAAFWTFHQAEPNPKRDCQMRSAYGSPAYVRNDEEADMIGWERERCW